MEEGGRRCALRFSACSYGPPCAPSLHMMHSTYPAVSTSGKYAVHSSAMGYVNSRTLCCDPEAGVSDGVLQSMAADGRATPSMRPAESAQIIEHNP